MTFIKVSIKSLRSPMMAVVKEMFKSKVGIAAIVAFVITIVCSLIPNDGKDFDTESGSLGGAIKACTDFTEMAKKALMFVCFAVLILSTIIAIPSETVKVCTITLSGALASDIIWGIISGFSFGKVKEASHA